MNRALVVAIATSVVSAGSCTHKGESPVQTLASEQACVAGLVFQDAGGAFVNLEPVLQQEDIKSEQDLERFTKQVRALAVARYAQERWVAYAALDSALNHSATVTDSLRYARIADLSLASAKARDERATAADLASDYRDRFLDRFREASSCRQIGDSSATH